MRRENLNYIIGLITFLGACSGDETIDGFTNQEWAEIAKLSPLGDPPPDPTNRVANDPGAAALGQMLFFEKELSGPVTFDATPGEGALGVTGDIGRYACTSCHDPAHNFVDVRSNPVATSLGTGGWLGHNALTLVNAVYYDWTGWWGFVDTLWGHSLIGVEAGIAANGDRLRTAHLLYAKYRTQYNAVFDPDLDPALDPAAVDAARFPASGKPKAPMAPDGDWEMMAPADQALIVQIFVNTSKACNAYLRKLVKKQAPFDRYVAGETTAISSKAKEGLKLFIGKAACIKCHEGPFFSDQKFHNTGVPQEGLHVSTMDTGRDLGIILVKGPLREWSSAGANSDDTSASKVDALVADPKDMGAFRTQGLRNVAGTAPYMHTGQFADLREVIKLYNEGGKKTGFVGVVDDLIKPLNLTDPEIDALVAFLETLTGEPLPAELLTDTSVP
ncbi:MAG: uncharacterized protein JWO36_3051 [Myxococcales bacterium]|nr:uncharacterized protein [Myxococcales bacterium]